MIGIKKSNRKTEILALFLRQSKILNRVNLKVRPELTLRMATLPLTIHIRVRFGNNESVLIELALLVVMN